MYKKTMTETMGAMGDSIYREVTEYYYSGTALMSFKVSKYLDTSLYESNTAWLLYDEGGDLIGIQYGGVNYYYSKNIQGDVLALVKQDGTVVAKYTYDAWGKLQWVKDAYGGLITSSSHIGNINPMRYRGYYYDRDLGLYYLQSRFYDANTGRFINADGYVSTGQGLLSQNMFAYCGNNPINCKDSTGKFWISALVTAIVAACTLVLSGCSAKKNTNVPREDLVKAPKLDVSTAPSNSYNCYGNGIGKQIDTSPTGYKSGDSTRKTFDSVKNDLGSKNVRELNSIDDPIENDEFKVAIKCGPTDYHFIRLDGDRWYNKSGTAPGLYVDQSVVASDTWCAIWMNNGQVWYGSPFYNDETIYFAVKKEWDVS